MSGVIQPGVPADPTHFTIEFHSDGRMIFTRTNADGGQERTEWRTTPETLGNLLVITANPGGVQTFDGTHERGRRVKQGAFFEMEIRRLY